MIAMAALRGVLEARHHPRVVRGPEPRGRLVGLVVAHHVGLHRGGDHVREDHVDPLVQQRLRVQEIAVLAAGEARRLSGSQERGTRPRVTPQGRA